MNTEFVTIKQISYKETYPVRQIVLRPNRPLETCFFDGDELESTVHLGSFVNNELVGIISLFKNDSSSFQDKNQYQIRGMAVLDDFRKYGLGKKIVEHSENYLKQNDILLIWFNARESAVGFYQKSGYEIVGNPFDIPDVGIHYVMYKML